MSVIHPHVQLMKKSLEEGQDMYTKNLISFSEIIDGFLTDIQIICPGIILPGHKYVLSSRSEILANVFSSGVNELDWSAYESDVGIALLRWFYTDKIVTDNETVKLGLLRASHNFGLTTLFETCESELSISVNERCFLEFYEIALEVNAKMLAEKCMEFKSFANSTSRHQMQIHKGVSSNSSCSRNFDLRDLNEVSRDEVNSILKRKEELETKSIKLEKSLLGIKKYLTFFDTTFWFWPAHTYVLCARSEKFRDKLPNDGLSIMIYFAAWSGLRKDVELALKRWLYTDVVCLDSEALALDLLQASRDYDLHPLFELCEQSVTRTVNITSCANVHRIASKVHATKILEQCNRITSAYWDVSKSELIKVHTDVDNPANMKTATCGLPTGVSGTLLMLNDDCLLHLFRFISLADLGCIKDTCKRLNQLADQSYKLYGNKSLEIRRSSLVADIWNLRHFGKFMKSLTLIDCYKPYCSLADILQMIARFASEQLESICLCLNFDDSITAKSLKCLKKTLKNVNKIELNYFHDGKLMELLLSYCENLIEIHIDSEELEMKTLWCSKNLNITTMTLNGLLSDDVLEDVRKNLVRLESFSFSFIEDTSGKLNHLSRLKHLKQLSIGYYFENFGPLITPLLQTLARKNVLESLTILGFEMDGTAALAFGDFSKLKQMVFKNGTFLHNSLEIFSEKLVSVEKLTFIDCEHITFGDITKMIANQSNFKELTVSGCENIGFIDRQNYLRLRKRRNLQIFLDTEVYERTMELIGNDLSDSVKITAKPLISD